MRQPARVLQLAERVDSKSIKCGFESRPGHLRIRPAAADDTRALAEVHVAAWQAGYRGLMPDDYLSQLSIDEREEMWRTILAGDESTVLVAGDGPDSVDGFVAFVPAVREIRALYVAPARFGQGIGSALLEAAHAQLTPDCALWVLEGNDRALRFYARYGYAPDGARTIHEPTGLTELRLTRQMPE
jgi:GNAT superfamily N-acetyltransferase